MGWKSRQEREIRRLIELGRPVSTVRKNIGGVERSYNVAATIRKVENVYFLLLDIYYPTGSTGETIQEKGMTFNDMEEALHYLKNEFDIMLHEFKP
jgi:hypothetical protein